MSAQYIFDQTTGLLTGVFYGMPQQANGTFIAPPPQEDGVAFRFVDGEWKRPAIDKRITRLAFLNRFTMEEWIQIDTARATVPAVKYFMTKVEAARHIDLGLEEVRIGARLIAATGLLTEARLVEILEAPILPAERLESAAEVAA